jgi:PST family polysaccharide transporter
MLQTVASRGVQFVSEVILAWWLSKTDFGLRSDALTILAFATLLQDYGVNQVLIHRQHRLARWANPAFWLSLTIGILGGVVLAIAAPFVARGYGASELTGMIMILAARSPLNALGTVSYAKLQADLRYKALSVVGFLTVCVTAIACIALAKYGAGAYAFIWPLLIAAIARSAMLWTLSPPQIRWHLQFRRWKYLVGQSGMLLIASALFTLTSQGDYMTLGFIYHDKNGPAPLVGVYFFGFMLCVQTTQFITSNLANVLLPTFSKLQHEPERLKKAFLRATQMLAITGVFVCLLQAAVAAPMVQAILRVKGDPGKWIPAVPILQVISLAMALQLFNMPAQSLIQAQGRFFTLLKVAIICPVVFFSLVWSAAATGSRPDGQIRWLALRHLLNHIFPNQAVDVSVVVAIAVVIYCAIIGPFCLHIAIRPIGGKWREIWPIYLRPVITSLLAILIGMIAGHPLPHSTLGNWSKLLVVPMVSVLAYIPLAWMSAPTACREIWTRVHGLMHRSKAS